MTTMFMLVVLLGFSVCCGVCSVSSQYIEPDYYWREYDNGEVPSDAIPGGRDKYGGATYIGGVVHMEGNGLIIGNIYPGLYTEAEYGITDGTLGHNQTKYLQILCSRHIGRYKWVPINFKDFDKVDGLPVRAGKEHGWDLYVGRGIHGDEMKVAKVIHETNKIRDHLRLPTGPHTNKILENYELLVYSKACSCTCCDD